MSTTTELGTFLSVNAWRVPLLLVWLVGGILALVTWRRHPLVSGLSLGAFALLAINSVLGAALFWYMVERGGPRALRNLGNGILTLANVVAWALLLVALFIRRPQPPGPAWREPERRAEWWPDERPPDTGIQREGR
jgi:hypothetical protein